ncbi:MAG TPA: methyltransferase domain-containing protein [Thermoflexus sp.]|nr:methyltransferase domain-containing protein [Thermoflexus sp.]
MTVDPKDQVRDFFSQHASSYAVSASHRAGRDLERLVALLAPTGVERLLDVATGTGHTALALAPQVREVIGLDLTLAMGKEFAALARERGFPHARFVVGDVEAVPFPEACFELVTCRRAAHHFPNPARALAEMARVLSAGGRLGLVDMVAPEDPASAQFLNQLERARDTSHQRALSVSEWLALVEASGLRVRIWEVMEEQYLWSQWLYPVPADTPAAARALALAQTAGPDLADVVVTTAQGDLIIRKRRIILVADKSGARR